MVCFVWLCPEQESVRIQLLFGISMHACISRIQVCPFLYDEPQEDAFLRLILFDRRIYYVFD